MKRSIVATLFALAALALAGCSSNDEADEAGCTTLPERDRSTLVGVIVQGDSFNQTLSDLEDSIRDESVSRSDWLERAEVWLAVMRSSVAEQRRLIATVETDGLRDLLKPGLADYAATLSGLTAFRRALAAGDGKRAEAAADRLDATREPSRRRSEQFTDALFRDYCNPPPLPARPE